MRRSRAQETGTEASETSLMAATALTLAAAALSKLNHSCTRNAVCYMPPPIWRAQYHSYRILVYVLLALFVLQLVRTGWVLRHVCRRSAS